MLDRDSVLGSRGANLVGRDGEKIGTIEDIYLDRETDEPEWAAVNTGLFGSRSTFVPLADATQQGSDLQVPYDKDFVTGAPNIDASGELSQSQEAELYRYYGLEYSETTSDSGLPEGRAGRRDTATATDEAMTRSEEELRVGKTEREAGRARLRKYVVGEQVSETVPVTRERARIEREPITDANVDDATGGPDISGAEHEVTLAEEEVVVEKRTVPKERVRLTKEEVTEEVPVSEEVRKEQIDVDGDVDTSKRSR
jgi:uncharacterized protein (TIGR02271 family)